MASKLLRNTLVLARPTTQITPRTPFLKQTINDLSNHSTRSFSLTATMAIKVDASFISQITAAEKQLTGSDEPVKGGPTAMAQKHVGQNLTAHVVHDITAGEKVITNSDEPTKSGPTSVAQSALSSGNSNNSNANTFTSTSNNTSTSSSNSFTHTGTLNSTTLHKITEAEKKLTGEDGPVRGGPTAQAQTHANEPITSQALHDITEGEKKVTGGERVKGGPTSVAQSELGKSRS